MFRIEKILWCLSRPRFSYCLFFLNLLLATSALSKKLKAWAMSIPWTREIAAHDQTIVNCVRIVAHTLGPAGPTYSDNHWSIYLLFSHSQESIRMNMRGDPESLDGYLSWTKQRYLLTSSAIRHWDFPTTQDVRVCDIVNHIYLSGRQRYIMSGGGSGCRYWVWGYPRTILTWKLTFQNRARYTILYDLAQKKWVSENAATQLWPDLLFRYHTMVERKPLHMVQGEFY